MDPDAPVQRPRTESRISYAQNAEDILLDRLFRGRPGSFLDVGGNHPFLDNNTYFFYLRGWRGVNIEPTRRGIDLFSQHRPEDRNLGVAVSDEDGELPFYEVENEDGLSGLSTLSAEVAEAHREDGFTVIERRVPVRTLGSLVSEHRIEPPDLLSIDVEGSEGRVIAGIPLATWRPKCLVIEATAPLSGEPSHRAWEPTLLAHGYLFAAFNGVNRFYLRDDLRDDLHVFETPVNMLDHYYRHETVILRNQADEYRDRFEREKAAREFDAAQQEQLRQAWEWGRVQSQHAQAVWDQDRNSFARERESWKAAFDHFEATQTHFQREQADWQRLHAENELARANWERERSALLAEREAQHVQIAATQTQLRPYRLIDRFGVVQKGYRLVRRIKRKVAS
jgi:FkbM family methyltransferase